MTALTLKGWVQKHWIDMRWQIKDFEFSEQQQTLTYGQNTVRMEPMVSELLAYFCRHQNQIISKDQLLNDVWHGRYVSDNTVSKLITKLRKTLLDDARNPEFISTIPKRGYRFIAAIEHIEEPVNTLSIAEFTTPAQPGYRPLLLLILFFTITSIVWFSLSPSSSPNVIISAKAVTSDEGREYFPSFASDGLRLAYMNNNGEKFKLYVKNIYSGEQVEINHGEELGVGPGSWNDNGTKLVYLVGTQTSCQYFIRQFDGLVMSEPQLIYTCKPGSFGIIKFTHDDNILIYSESPGMGKPYSIYSLEVDTGKTKWLPQPDLHLGGNSQFDIHPTENKLLISSPDEEQWEGFYQLDLDNQKLSLLFKLNAYICCGIWAHDGEHVVMMGEHPAREIVQYDLEGNNKTVLFTGPQQLSRPERYTNGIDYGFTVFNYNLNVDEYSINENQSFSLLNDSFDERLAVLSPNTKQVAYISLTSGNEELWLYDRDSSKKKKVTQFADGRHYVDLVWSTDVRTVAGLTLNSIHIIDLATGETRLLPLPEKEFRGLSFKSPNIIAFSMKLGSNWQVVEYNLTDNTMERLAPKWKSVQYVQSSKDWLWIDQDDYWYLGESPTPFKLPKENISAFYGRQFNVKKSGEHIVFHDWQDEKLYIYNIGSAMPVNSIETQVGHFSIVGDLVLVSQTSSKNNNSDIYKTYRVNAK